jgi:uncharacterized protein YkwD
VILSVLTALTLAVSPPPQAPTRAVPPARVAGPGCATSTGAAATVCEINAARRAHGLPALKSDPRLASAAGSHARDMVMRRYFAHQSMGGSSPRDRIARTGWFRDRRTWWIGEDLAWGSGAEGSPKAIVGAWLKSPPHRRILLSPRAHVVGVGVATGTPTGPSAAGTTYDADFGS